MAENDIYNSKGLYERFVSRIKDLTLTPEEYRNKYGAKTIKQYCKNTGNLFYFRRLAEKLEARGISYKRRLRLMQSLKLITFLVDKDLKKVNEKDKDVILGYINNTYNGESLKTIRTHVKFLWKLLLPNKRIMEDIRLKMDKSTQMMKRDKLTWQEYETILEYFSQNTMMKAFITFSVECLGRPQELMYLKLKNVHIEEGYAKIYIAEHGKEGIGLLRCVDSFPYILKWYNEHPYKNNPEGYLFVNSKGKQLTPYTLNKRLRTAVKQLGLNKPITCYSLKRNGVTFRRLRGDSDLEIQHVARWTSTKQLKIYDLSDQEDSLKIELIKRGLIKDEQYKDLLPKTKNCIFCKQANIGFNEKQCPRCLRIIDSDKLKEIMGVKDAEKQKLDKLFGFMQYLMENHKEIFEEFNKRKIAEQIS